MGLRSAMTKRADCGHESNSIVIHLVGDKSFTSCYDCHEKALRAAYNPKTLRRERRPLEVGYMTLVGVMGFAEPSGCCPKCGHDHVADPKCVRYGDGVTAICEVNGCGAQLPVKDPFPLHHGNCCSVLNMNAENVIEALKRWPDLAKDCEVEIVEFRGRERVRVVDARIPSSWLGHNCTICGIFEGGDEESPREEPPSSSGSPLQGKSELGTGYIYSPFVPYSSSTVDLSSYDLKQLKETSVTKPINLEFFGRFDVVSE